MAGQPLALTRWGSVSQGDQRDIIFCSADATVRGAGGVPEVSGGLSRTEAQRGGRFLLRGTAKHGSTFVSPPCLIPQRGNKVTQWSPPQGWLCAQATWRVSGMFFLTCLVWLQETECCISKNCTKKLIIRFPFYFSRNIVLFLCKNGMEGISNCSEDSVGFLSFVTKSVNYFMIQKRSQVCPVPPRWENWHKTCKWVVFACFFICL